MKRTMIILFAAAALASCGGQKKTPALNPDNFDESYALNDDFYEHFTAGWQKRNPLTAEYSRFGAFDMLRQSNELRVKELFAEIEKTEAEKGTVEQKLADLYRLGLDSTRLNAEGAAPLKAYLERIESLCCRECLSSLLGSIHRTSANPFFASGVGADEKNTSVNVLYIGQAGIGIGDRDYYFDESAAQIREAYESYIKKVTTLAGYTPEEAARIAESVLRIEKSLAESHFTNVERRNPHKNYNKLTLKQLKREFKNIDWDAYAAAMGFEMPEELIVSQRPALARANKLIGTEDLRTIKDYLIFHEIRSAASYLSDEFTATNFDFYGRTLSGSEQERPRWKRALSTADGNLSEAVGKKYVEKYFPQEYKTKMIEIVANLQTALGKHIDALDWMSDATKVKAQEKLASFTVKIGYPESWEEYTSLEIDPALSYLENIRAISAWHTADNLADLGQPVDKAQWLMSPQTVNAYYNPTTNEICFPAAILQPPFFNPDADDAVNYGAIGVVIGHEMTHGFDDQGRQYNKDGNLNDWWTKEDAEAFDKRAQVLVEQFDAIEVNEEGLHANGTFTLGENIADQGGLRVAMTALRDSWGENKPQPIDGFTAEQRFYIAYATLWAQNIRPQEIVRLTKVDPHSLGKWRVNGTLPNIADWYEAFGITEGDMYRAPEDRVIIW
ncbi:MAG: M13 family metallopeptidase [Tidjanibacter sp.]|nr:M13 family metallopeptidase [Tidjanibacter sp.]